MAWTDYLPIFNYYVYSDLWPLTLDQGHDQELWLGRTPDGQRHNIIRPGIRPVWRPAYKNKKWWWRMENIKGGS
jgi:hypothetical protein